MSENNQSKKPVFLYVVIAVLTIAVIGLGALSFLSLSHLVSLQQKVQTLSDTVEDISTTSNTLISQADQLNQLKEQEAAQQNADGQNHDIGGAPQSGILDGVIDDGQALGRDRDCCAVLRVNKST